MGAKMAAIKDIEILRKRGLSFAKIAEEIGNGATKHSVQKLFRRSRLDKVSKNLYDRSTAAAGGSKTLTKTSTKDPVVYTDPYAWLLEPKKRPAVKQTDFVGLTIGYFDIETTFSMWSRFLCGSVADHFGNVTTISVATHPGKNVLDDGPAVKAYAELLSQFDILVSWNGKLFDVPRINARLAYHGLPLLYPRMHIDAMYLAKGSMFNIGRKSLANAEAFFEAKNGKTPLSPRIWDKADHGDDEEFDTIVRHCEADVLVLREIFDKLKAGVSTIHR
jgi:DNA polymerase elongation subunit (family B)